MRTPILIIFFALQVVLLAGCNSSEADRPHEHRPSDALYTEEAALQVFSHQPEQAMAILDSAVAVGNLDEGRASLLRTEAEIGVILVKLGEEGKGLAKLNGVIASLDGQRRLDEMDACIIALKRKIQVLQELGREEEVIPTAKRIVAIISDYNQNREAYVNNSYRLTGNKEEMDDYCGFYTDQASIYLAHAYATIGATDSARHFLSLFESSDYSHTLVGRRMMAPTWCLLGDYGKMLATYDEVDALMGADTLNPDYVEMLRNRAIAAADRGDYHAAIDYWQRCDNLNSQVDRKIQWGQFNQYAIHYQLEEERLNTEREHTKARNNRIFAILGGTLFLIAIGFLARLWVLHCDIKRKNRVLVEQLAEKVQIQQQPAEPLTPANLNTLNDEELFSYLSEVIHREKLYLDPLFERQKLIDRFALSKERIGAAFSKGSQFSSLASFVNEERLMHAARLLVEQPEMSMVDVAAASGFANGSTFARNFKQRFAITPTRFREERPSLP